MSKGYTCLALMVLFSCAAQEASPGAIDTSTVAAPLASNSPITVQVSSQIVHQTISGMGASSAWSQNDIPSPVIARLYNKSKGIGLHWLRVRIAPDGSCAPGEIHAAQQVVALGGQVWATPWSPPAQWKSNNSVYQGGRLLPQYYQAYADQLVKFVQDMNNQGVPIAYISAQNEPNYSAPWESCLFSPTELANFIGSYLGPSLQKAGCSTKVLGPETTGFDVLASYTQALSANSKAMQSVAVVATHDYYGTIAADPFTTAAGKLFWMTEMTQADSTGADDLNVGLETAMSISKSFVDAQMNAWHYWWISANDQSGLWQDGHLSFRAYAMAHFVHSLAPQFVRIDTKMQNSDPNIYFSAYRNADKSNFSIVGVNLSTEPRQVYLSLDWHPDHLNPVETNAKHRYIHTPKIFPTSQTNTFVTTLPAQSIVSWHGP